MQIQKHCILHIHQTIIPLSKQRMLEQKISQRTRIIMATVARQQSIVACLTVAAGKVVRCWRKNGIK